MRTREQTKRTRSRQLLRGGRDLIFTPSGAGSAASQPVRQRAAYGRTHARTHETQTRTTQLTSLSRSSNLTFVPASPELAIMLLLLRLLRIAHFLLFGGTLQL